MLDIFAHFLKKKSNSHSFANKLCLLHAVYLKDIWLMRMIYTIHLVHYNWAAENYICTEIEVQHYSLYSKCCKNRTIWAGLQGKQSRASTDIYMDCQETHHSQGYRPSAKLQNKQLIWTYDTGLSNILFTPLFLTSWFTCSAAVNLEFYILHSVFGTVVLIWSGSSVKSQWWAYFNKANL